MGSHDLHSKLINSDAFLSLSAEQRISSILQKLKWKAIHSCFYTDLKTEKLREIDVLGSQSWERKLKILGHYARLNLVVEAKSAKGYHLLFSQLKEPPVQRFRQVNDEWIGSEGKNHEKVAQTLSNSSLNSEQVAFVFEKFKKLAYPRKGASIFRLLIKPPPPKLYCSAFRETNIGNVKDLDGSVLWRASQSLQSAVSALKEQQIEFHLEELAFDIEMASIIKLDPVQQALERLNISVRFVELFHPVVVIDAPLWLAEEGAVKDISWCRFEQQATRGISDWWFDVVHSSYFDQYSKELTEYYQKQFKRVRARLYKL